MKKDQSTLQKRGFNTRVGAVLAASGCAVGIGNIWGFPIKTAENHGAAFVLVYFVLAFFLAYPVLIAEFAIGKHFQCNPVSAMAQISRAPFWKTLGAISAIISVTTVSIIYSFYSIIGGWFIGHCVAPIIFFIQPEWAQSFTNFSDQATITLALSFMLLTTCIVTKEVKDGIELWSKRLMPLLFILMILLIIFTLFQPGSLEGLKVYLVPDFSYITDPQLLISALGQSFFSMSLGVGTMMVYGSYLNKKDDNLAVTTAQVVIIDSTAAFLAGLLIIPCMYAAMHAGITIFSDTGHLYRADKLVFQVLPALFSKLESPLEQLITIAFFFLLTITALTSSIAMLETPVSCISETQNIKRSSAAWIVSLACGILCIVIIINMDWLFALIVSITTEHMMPILSLMITVYCGWLWRQKTLINTLQINTQGNKKTTLFWHIWLWYIRLVCPALILILIWQSL